jgi:hypothetical protein
MFITWCGVDLNAAVYTAIWWSVDLILLTHKRIFFFFGTFQCGL